MIAALNSAVFNLKPVRLDDFSRSSACWLQLCKAHMADFAGTALSLNLIGCEGRPDLQCTVIRFNCAVGIREHRKPQSVHL